MNGSHPLAAAVAYLVCGALFYGINAYGIMSSPGAEAERWREAAARRPILTAIVWTLLLPFWPLSLVYATWRIARK